MNDVLIIAGEQSGEEHAMSFLPQLRELRPDLHFFGVGGEQLHSQGVELSYHLREFSSWGISSVITKIPFYYKAMNKILDEVKKRDCKYAILIDFQTFNLKLAKKLKKMNVKVLYYVAPQAWVWKAWRAKALANTVEKLYTILPFEKEWFSKRGVKQISSVPHPIISRFKDLMPPTSVRSFKEVNEQANILVLPGSRDFEVEMLLPEFIKSLDIIKENRNIKTAIVLSPSVSTTLYSKYSTYFDTIIDAKDLGTALEWSDVAISASGTVTLSCALFVVPSVVTYKVSLLNEFIISNFLNYTGYYSLANIVHKQEVFKELMQENAKDFFIAQEIEKILSVEENYLSRIDCLRKTFNLLEGDVHDVAADMSAIMD